MRNLKLQRAVKNSIRYYFMSIQKTLFGDWILQVEYGAIKNKRPTGSFCKYFQNSIDASCAFVDLEKKKLKKGYVLY